MSTFQYSKYAGAYTHKICHISFSLALLHRHRRCVAFILILCECASSVLLVFCSSSFALQSASVELQHRNIQFASKHDIKFVYEEQNAQCNEQNMDLFHLDVCVLVWHNTAIGMQFLVVCFPTTFLSNSWIIASLIHDALTHTTYSIVVTLTRCVFPLQFCSFLYHNRFSAFFTAEQIVYRCWPCAKL